MARCLVAQCQRPLPSCELERGCRAVEPFQFAWPDVHCIRGIGGGGFGSLAMDDRNPVGRAALFHHEPGPASLGLERWSDSDPEYPPTQRATAVGMFR
jgi:hypothetical protein